MVADTKIRAGPRRQRNERPVRVRLLTSSVVGLEGVEADIAVVATPDGHGRLELTKFHSLSDQGGIPHGPANTRGIRHVAFALNDIDAVVASL